MQICATQVRQVVWQAAPPLPQASVVVPGKQAVFPWQQPVGHDVGSQTQLLATQWRPVSHGSEVPHWHVPVAEQPSAVAGSHETQVPPPLPQVAREDETQTPLAQQPLGHD